MLILFLLSLFVLLYFIFIDKAIKSNYPLIYQFIIVFFLFLVLASTSLVLLIFIIRYYLKFTFKDFLVKRFSSGKDNASYSASQGSGGNSNQNNNNNSNNDFKIPTDKKPKRETTSQPRTPKELEDSNNELDNLNTNLRGYTKKNFKS